MACVLRACTCHFVEPHAKGCCSFPRTTHMCAFCVHTGNFICGYLCCFCIASFQNAVQKNKLKTIKSLLFCLPANVGSGDLFFRAIEENRPRVIKMLIKNGGNPNIMMDTGELAVENAAVKGRVDVLRELVKAGAKPAQGESGSTPLVYIAVKAGQLEVVRYLVRECRVALDSDQMRFWDQVPLKRAVELDHYEIAQLLCESGSDIEAESYPNTDASQFTETALSIAIKAGNLRMVHLMLKFGAHRRHKIKFRRRLYDMDELAKQFHQDEILELFKKWELRVALMHRDDMVEASMIGDLERVDVQLQRDYPDINHVHRKIGWAAMHKAAENEDIEMMQYLLDHGADINVKNKDGISPILHSVRLNNLESMEFLVKNKADPDIRNNRGDTPFSIAVRLGYERILNGLLRSGAGEKTIYSELVKLNEECHPNVKAMLAAEFESIMINRGDALVGLAHDGNTEMITRLVEIYGADVNHVHSKDVQQGRTAIFAAAEMGWTETMSELVRLGANIHMVLQTGENLLMKVVQWGHLGALQCLLRLGLDVNFSNELDGKSALRIAVDQGYISMTKELLLAGAIVDWTDKIEFQSPLHRACIHGFFEIMVLLLDSGADIERRDRTYTTPLLHSCWNKHIKLCAYLIKRGAQWNTKNTQGLTPLDVALQVSRGDLIHLFNNFRKRLLKNRCSDLESCARARNVDGVQEILGSTMECVHTYPEPFRRAHDDVLRVMENHGRGLPPSEYKKVRSIHELFVSARALLSKEFATLQLIDWIRKGDARLVDRYLDVQLGSVSLDAPTSREGTTALIVAVECDNAEIVKLLLKYGAKVNVTNKFTRFSPLMAAAKNNNIDTLKLLLKAGADPFITELIGDKTAARYAGNIKTLKLLQEYEKLIKDVKDEERRDRELAIYSQELGVPLDWFAAKRKEKLAEAKKKHREEMLEKKRSVSRATGLSKLLEGDEEDEDGTASESDVSFTSGSSYSYSVDDSDADLTDRDEDEDGEDKVDEDDDDKWRPPSRDAEAAFHDSRSQASSKMSGSYSLRHNPAREAEEMETELEMVGRRKKSVYPSPKSTSGLSTGKAK